MNIKPIWFFTMAISFAVGIWYGDTLPEESEPKVYKEIYIPYFETKNGSITLIGTEEM